jgi:serine O-acetyltransferase
MKKNDRIEKICHKFLKSFDSDEGIDFLDTKNFPVRKKIVKILKCCLKIFSPGYSSEDVSKDNIKEFICSNLSEIYEDIVDQIKRAFLYSKMEDVTNVEEKAKVTAETILLNLVDAREKIKGDIKATFDGDPSAVSLEEIAASYPGIFAIAIHRIAHEFYNQNVAIISRLIAEYAHTKTGIDIHPGAVIGNNFFIDHGTGVVVGETAIIGNNVKVYQGVTLGATSPLEYTKCKTKKRHPTIEDNVIIYAEATILGDVVIGKGSIIGGNVWLKETIPQDTIVTMAHCKLIHRQRKIK